MSEIQKSFTQGATQKQILDFLAQNEPKTMNEISKDLGLDYSYVNRTFKKLERRRLIESAKNKSYRNRNFKTYRPTLQGLIFAIRNVEKRDIDKIAHHNGHLVPLVLGKWEYFSRMGLREEAGQRLENACRQHVIIEGQRVYSAEFIALQFHNPLFCPSRMQMRENWIAETHKSQLRWLKACIADKDLRTYIINRLEELKHTIEEQISYELVDLSFIGRFAERELQPNEAIRMHSDFVELLELNENIKKTYDKHRGDYNSE